MTCPYSTARDCCECNEAHCPLLDEFYPEEPRARFDWADDGEGGGYGDWQALLLD